MADLLAAQTGVSKAVAKERMDGVFTAIGDPLANDEEVHIATLANFGTKSRPTRARRNPRTGDTVSI